MFPVASVAARLKGGVGGYSQWCLKVGDVTG